MDQRAAAMKAATQKKPMKSKFDSSDDNEDSDYDAHASVILPPKPQQAAAPVQSKPAPVTTQAPKATTAVA